MNNIDCVKNSLPSLNKRSLDFLVDFKKSWENNFMKKFILLTIVFLLNGCAITQVGKVLPGKMYSVDSEKEIDFGIEIVLATMGGGQIFARDDEENADYSGSYSYNPIRDFEGYNTRGNLYGPKKSYTIHLVITPSLTTPKGKGVAKENGEVKYRIEFPVYDWEIRLKYKNTS